MLPMFEVIFFIVVVGGVIAIDHRLNTLVKIQRQIHKEHLLANAARAEIVKALQWMVDNWKQEGSKQPDHPPV